MDTTTTEIEIEDDLLKRAHDVYPGSATHRELLRRLVEKGLCTREAEVEDHELENQDEG